MTTAAAVLAFVQAGITSITTVLAWTAMANIEGGALAAQALIALAQTAGVVLLIWGGVQLMAGKGVAILIAGVILELVLCVVYLTVYSSVDTGGHTALDQAKAVLVAAALFFAVMPTIALVLSRSAATMQYLASRR